MATRSIKFSYTVGGVLTNVTSAVLRDPTNAFGLKHLSDSVIVKVAGTAIPPVAGQTGRYLLDVDVTPGDNYEYWVEWTTTNGTDRRQRLWTPAADVAAGTYVDQSYLELIRGEDNIRVWSRKGGSQNTPDVPAIQAAIDKATSRINSTLRARYYLPLRPEGGGATPTEDLSTLKGLAEPIAAFELYRTRGLKDRDVVGKLLQAEYQEAVERLEEFADLANERILVSEQIDVVNNAPTIVK